MSMYTRESLIEFLEDTVARIAWWRRSEEIGARELREQGHIIVDHSDGPEDPIVFTDVSTGEVIGRQPLEDFLGDRPLEGSDHWLHQDHVRDWYVEQHPDDPEPPYLDNSPWWRLNDVADDEEAVVALLNIVRG